MNQEQQPPVLSVSQITHHIKNCLESSFPSLWIEGEISNCRLQSSGHLYFSLKDAQAQISAVMFRGQATTLQRLPKDGDSVIVHGALNVYPPSGKYQLVVNQLRFKGVGELLIRLEELKKKLHQRGWFDKSHKKRLPKLPRCIGVVTSPTGAAIQDILKVLTRRFSTFHLILNPVKVQGDGAAKEIADAINSFNDYGMVDVIIVGRGGGSIEDLWAFNEEVVAEAIFKSSIPIIGAVGHETDHTIAEYVADVRAPTPSAAAEMVIAEKEAQLQLLMQAKKRLLHLLSQLAAGDRRRLNSIVKQPFFQSPYALLGPLMQRLDDQRQLLDGWWYHYRHKAHLMLDGKRRQLDALKPATQLHHLKQKLAYWRKNIDSAIAFRIKNDKGEIAQKSSLLHTSWTHILATKKQLFVPSAWQRTADSAIARVLALHRERQQQMASALKAIDPRSLLAKGYAITFAEKSDSVINSIKEIEVGDKINLLMHDGQLTATVNKKRENLIHEPTF